MTSTAAQGAGTADRPLALLRARLREKPAASAFGVCIVVSIISAVALSWVPSSDPYAWLAWGQEIASHVGSSPISVGLAGGPSWKPFPAAFTAVFGLFGSAAPGMWLVIPRVAGLMALVAAFRLGKRFGGVAAGILAALALCLIQDWMFYVARGASEPIVAALTLWAIDRHLSGMPRLAYVLLFAAALNRPEFTAFMLAYGVYLWLKVPSARVLSVVLLVLVPIAWLVPPWVITGDALQASNAAKAGKGSPGSAIAELRASPALMTVPVLVLAAVAFGFALARREVVLQWLAGGAIVWALMVAVMTQVFYGLPRYMLPAAAVGCVLAGVAVVRIGELAGKRGGRWAAFAVGGVVLAATLPWTIPRVKTLFQEAHSANRAARYQRGLFASVDQVGGKRVVLPCFSSHVAINHTVASALAWKLRVPLHRVEPSMRSTGFVFRAPHFAEVGLPPPIARGRTVTRIAGVSPWSVLEVTFPGASLTPRCGPGDRA